MRLRKKSQNHAEEKKLNNSLSGLIHPFALIFRVLIIVSLCLIQPSSAFAALYSSGELTILAQIHQLELDDAEKKISLSKATPSLHALSEMSSFLKCFLNGNPKDYSIWKNRREILLKSLVNFTSRDLRKSYFESEIYMHQGWLELRSGNETRAAYYFREAYLKLKSLRKFHPNYMPALKNMAILEAASVHLPSGYQKLLAIAGLEHGYVEKLNKLTLWTQTNLQGEDYWLGRECAYIMAFTYHHLRKNQQAWNITLANTSDYKQNPLALYVRSLIAYRQGKSQLTKGMLSLYALQNNKYKIPALFYLRGLTRLQSLDYNSALDFKLFLQTNDGHIYRKAAYLKLAWICLLKNDMKGYHDWLIKVKSAPDAIAEEDRQAELEASRNEIPDTLLLKARLLFDGAYFKDALNTIRPAKASDFQSVLKQTEYCYRKGRIYDELGEKELALAFYKATASTGKTLNAYYAAYACLFMADIFVEQHNYTEAEKYYKQAIGFKANKEYLKTIEFRASEGLRKLPD